MGLIVESIVGDVVLILAAIITIVFFYVKYVIYSYWERHGIESPDTIVPFGNFYKAVMQQTSLAELTQDLYNSTTKPFIGFYITVRPMLLIRDPELVRYVLNTDFQSFHDRGIYYDEKNDPLTANLLSMSGEKWRTMRSKVY